MIETPLLLSGLIFVGIMLLIIGMYSFLRYLREHRNLMEKVKHDGVPADQKQVTGPSPKSQGNILGQLSSQLDRQYLTKVMAKMGNLTRPKKGEELSQLQLLFLRAGYRNRNTSSIYFGLKGLLTILFPLAFFSSYLLAIKSRHLISPLSQSCILLMLALLGYYLPYLWVRLKIAARKEKIFAGFPDVLDLLVVCVEAGVGINAAIQRVSEELKFSHKEISEELQILNLELRAGKPRPDALKGFSRRIDLEEINALVNLLIQTDRFGTSIAKALRVYSDTMRTRRYQRAQEQAAKLPVKLLFPLIFFIFPALFVVILGPALIQVVRIMK